MDEDKKVTVFIWPNEEGAYGHVGLQTDKYYVSFWPNVNKHEIRDMASLQDGVLAALIFHKQLDDNAEKNPNPRSHHISSRYVSCSDVNHQIEKFLRFNDVCPENYTLEEIEKQVENTGDHQCAKAELSNTKYLFTPKLVDYKKWGSSDWYNEPQSCVSFCYNIVESANSNVNYLHHFEETEGADYRPLWLNLGL
jgi:hypothetical protein